MGTMKVCQTCGNRNPHHSDCDVMCMDCEREKYYPDDEISGALVETMKLCTHITESNDNIKKSVSEFGDKKPKFLGGIFNLFK